MQLNCMSLVVIWNLTMWLCHAVLVNTYIHSCSPQSLQYGIWLDHGWGACVQIPSVARIFPTFHLMHSIFHIVFLTLLTYMYDGHLKFFCKEKIQSWMIIWKNVFVQIVGWCFIQVQAIRWNSGCSTNKSLWIGVQTKDGMYINCWSCYFCMV